MDISLDSSSTYALLNNLDNSFEFDFAICHNWYLCWH